jgi:Leucine-rich repeat (LRR) protein
LSKICHLQGLPNLIFLDLYNNNIARIEGLACIPALRVLMLGKNNIQTVENLEPLRKLGKGRTTTPFLRDGEVVYCGCWCVGRVCVGFVCVHVVLILCVHLVSACCLFILCLHLVCSFFVFILCVHLVSASCVCILCLHLVGTSCVLSCSALSNTLLSPPLRRVGFAQQCDYESATVVSFD